MRLQIHRQRLWLTLLVLQKLQLQANRYLFQRWQKSKKRRDTKRSKDKWKRKQAPQLSGRVGAVIERMHRSLNLSNKQRHLHKHQTEKSNNRLRHGDQGVNSRTPSQWVSPLFQWLYRLQQECFRTQLLSCPLLKPQKQLRHKRRKESKSVTQYQPNSGTFHLLYLPQMMKK